MFSASDIFGVNKDSRSFSDLFDAPFATVSPDAKDFDLIDKLEQDAKTDELYRLGSDKTAFHKWLNAGEVKVPITSDILKTLVDCWLASKRHNTNEI